MKTQVQHDYLKDLGWTLVHGIQSLRTDSMLFDFIVITKEKCFPAHKVVLASVCPYFRLMFKTQQTMASIILDVQPDTVKIFLDYFYTGELHINKDNVDEIMKGAELLHLDDIQQCCMDFASGLQAEMCKSFVQENEFCTDSMTASCASHISFIKQEGEAKISCHQNVPKENHHIKQQSSEDNIFNSSLSINESRKPFHLPNKGISQNNMLLPESIDSNSVDDSKCAENLLKLPYQDISASRKRKQDHPKKRQKTIRELTENLQPLSLQTKDCNETLVSNNTDHNDSEKSFPSTSQLDKTPFFCSHCSAVSYDEKFLKKHIKYKHKFAILIKKVSKPYLPILDQLSCNVENGKCDESVNGNDEYNTKDDEDQEHPTIWITNKVAAFALDELSENAKFINRIPEDIENCYCIVCGFTCDSKTALEDHVQKHQDSELDIKDEYSGFPSPEFDLTTNLNMCPFCNFPSSENSIDLDIHIKSEHASMCKEVYTCTECGFEATGLQVLREHVKEIHDDDFDDDDDDNGEDEKTDLLPKRHSKFDIILTDKGSVLCEICNKEFKHRHSYWDHMRYVHNGAPKICDLCGYKTKYLHSLRYHQFVEHNIDIEGKQKEFAKCPHCPFVCWGEAMLKEHMNRHTQERPHLCQVCGKRFNQKSSLTEHIKYHGEERNYPCNLCPFSGKTRGALRQHVRCKHSTDKIKCPYCSYDSTMRQNVRLHIRRVHPGKSSDLPKTERRRAKEEKFKLRTAGSWFVQNDRAESQTSDSS